MMMGSWAARGFGDRALARLSGIVMVLCAAQPMAARTHPAPIRAVHEQRTIEAPAKHMAAKREAAARTSTTQARGTHETTSQGTYTHGTFAREMRANATKAQAKARRVVERETPEKPARGAKSKRKGHAKEAAASERPAIKSSAHAKPQARAAGKPKQRKLRPEEEADNDPLPLQRVAILHNRHEHFGVAARKTASSAAPATEDAPAIGSPKKVVTSEDFLRAAGVAPAVMTAKGPQAAAAAETFETGESHPEDDERLPMRASAATEAMVSAGPELATPAGSATLPEKLQTLAARAGSTVKADAVAAKNVLAKKDSAKPPMMPVDKADKDAVIEAAMLPSVLPVMYRRNGRLVVPPPMKGTHEILVHQNLMADSAGLDRIQDDEDLDRMRAQRLLVALPSSGSLLVNEDLPFNRRYARPWAARFAADMAKNFYANFHQPLRLNSAVRTVEYQRRLQRVNGNAAGTDGEDASPHLTGQALDFGKRGMSVAEIAWMRAYLAPLMQAGKIDVEEEFLQSCFHISVYKNYLPAARKAPPKMEVARVRPPPAVLPAQE